LAYERTFVAVKPDGVERGLIGEILQRFEKRGLRLVGLKIMNVTGKLAEEHYSEHKTKPFFAGLVKHLTSGPIVAMVWEGKNAVAITRNTIGATNPIEATPGSIRGDLSVDIGRNIVHGSDSPENGEREISIFFSADELLPSKEKTIDRWVWE
jgi:nucleoside-diphosphate kinase